MYSKYAVFFLHNRNDLEELNENHIVIQQLIFNLREVNILQKTVMNYFIKTKSPVVMEIIIFYLLSLDTYIVFS